MSNERSPRPVCSITMGITGDIACLLYSATNELRMLAWLPQIRNLLVARRGGTMSDEGTVEREITVPVDPERAWELVTEPEHLERWFAERVELDPTPGAPVRVVGDDGGERHGVVEEVDAPRRLRFVWYAPPDGRDRGDAGARRIAHLGDRARADHGRRLLRPADGAIPPHRPAGAGGGMSDAIGATFSALADPSRRRMLGLLGGTGATATQLARELPISRQAVAKHLSQLAAAGLVASRREGRETRYTVTPEPLEQAVAWMVQAGGEWDDRLARLGTYVAADRTA